MHLHCNCVVKVVESASVLYPRGAGAVPIEPFGGGAVLRHEPPLSVLLLRALGVLLVPHRLPGHGHLAARHAGVSGR